MHTVADLKRAESDIEDARARIDHQRETIAHLQVKGRDTTAAEAVLEDMVRLLQRVERRRDEIARELERAQNSD